jgi:membrane fusion protein, multidrug efflux system
MAVFNEWYMVRNVVIALLWQFIGFGCADKKAISENIETDSLTMGQVSVPVKTMLVNVKPIRNFITGQGKIRASQEYIGISRFAGYVKFLKARNGQRIAKNERILSFDLAELELTRRKVQSKLYQTRLEFESEKLGYNGGKSQLSDSVARMLRASSGLALAEIEFEEIDLELKRGTIVAPFSGRLANVKISEHAFVTVGEALFTLYTDDDLLMEINVLETDIHSVTHGQHATVTSIPNMEQSYDARVTEINPMVDNDGMIAVKLRLIGKNHNLLPGMNALAKIETPLHESVSVPKEAVVMRDGRSVVFTLEDGLAKWNYVVTGHENEEGVEILQGIRPGHRVIVTNNFQLDQDTRVSDGGPISDRQ